MNKYAKYVRATLDNRTLHEQLAEECSELSKASLKVIRAMGRNNNVTNLSPHQAMDNFNEEVQDLLAVLFLVADEEYVKALVNNMDDYWKWERWAKRLGYEDEQ